MSKSKASCNTIQRNLWARKSGYALAAAIATATANQAIAQDSESPDASAEPGSVAIEEVIVTGIRQNLRTSQDLKRDSATVIDSITAEDLGSFPDKSVAEALQRVAGITVNRFASTSDTAHFSAEPSGVIVRGLTQVRTEFNGRDSFSANSSRGLSWGDVSPALLAGVDTYKNQMAELIEGGIAGSVNMRTRLPFDQSGQMFAVDLKANYGDLAEEVTPEGSMLYSNRWEVSSGEFGFLGNIAHSNVQTKSEGNQLFRMNRFVDVYEGGASRKFIPAQAAMRDNLYDRTRTSVAAALQWQNTDETLVVTGQFNRSEYENDWEEYVFAATMADLSFNTSVFNDIGPFPGGEDRDNDRPRPAPDTEDFTFDERGLFQTGTATRGQGWWGGSNAESAQKWANNGEDEHFVVPCYNNSNNGWDGNGCSPSVRGETMSFATRVSEQTSITQDFSLNVKWTMSDTVRSNFDVQWVESEVDQYDIEMNLQSFANAAVDLRPEKFRVDLSEGTNVNWAEGGLTNPNNYFIGHVSDHIEDSEGEQFAARMDFEFDIDRGPLASIKMGARFAKREQEIKWSNYNWQNFVNTWSGNQQNYFNITKTGPARADDPATDDYDESGAQPGFNGYPEGFYELRSFGTDYHNLGQRELIFPKASVLRDRVGFANSMGATALGFTNGTGWDPVCSNTGDRAEEIPGTCVTPPELVDVSEETAALYAQLNFGGDEAELFGLPFSGNVGVRVVETTNIASGGISIPALDEELFFTPAYNPAMDDPLTPEDESALYQELNRDSRIAFVPGVTQPTCTPIPDTKDGSAPVPNTVGCYISEEDVAFLNDVDQLSTVEETHFHVLPSLNIKLEFTEKLQARLAISRAMSRPDMGNLRNFTAVEYSDADDGNAEDALWVYEGAEIVGSNLYYNAGGQNPYLEPIVADQLDVTLEYYFSDVGSLTFAVFRKDFDNYIEQGRYNRYITSNGVTRAVEVTGPVNGEGASLQGFEVAFQTFFDTLPEPFDGLGVQANFTYVDNRGITNPGTQNTIGEIDPDDDVQAPDSVEVDALENLSDTSYNLIGLYEKGDWSARLAYSWRDDYLVTRVDCCVALPVWQEDYGQLDASLSYQITEQIKIGFAATNLTGEETVTHQQVENSSDGGLLLPTGRFRNDTTYNLSVSFQL